MSYKEPLPPNYDNIYQTEKGPNPFKFDAAVTQVFDDMVHRSIPHYEKNIQSIVAMAVEYSQPNTLCYDLGCSLGKLSIALSQAPIKTHKIIAIDNSAEMLQATQQNIDNHKLQVPIELSNHDLNLVQAQEGIAKNPSSVIILNYTLQFLAPENRLPLLKKIKQSLVSKGILILCEKVRPQSEQAQHLFDKHYYEFKSQKGYHNLEISRKRDALENILIPDTVEEHHQRLIQAGFSSCEIWHKHLHFTSWIAWS
jgi:tRNA (cmo5U34)-methyltransferase